MGRMDAITRILSGRGVIRVIQIDMDMPVSCFYCPIKQRILTLGGKCMCFCVLNKHELNDTTKRHEFCPLIEVKEGGDT